MHAHAAPQAIDPAADKDGPDAGVAAHVSGGILEDEAFGKNLVFEMVGALTDADRLSLRSNLVYNQSKCFVLSTGCSGTDGSVDAF